MYTVYFNYLDKKERKLKIKKFMNKAFAERWLKSMRRKYPKHVAQIKGKNYYCCVM